MKGNSNTEEIKKEIKPLTMGEVVEFGPTFERPMEVVCSNGRFIHDHEKISIVGVHQDKFVYISAYNEIGIFHEEMLKHYASLKQPKDKIALYSTLDMNGRIITCTEDGEYPNFREKYFEGDKDFNEIRKANRQKEPCAYLDPDTFEVEWV